jgi:type I restriction enzyme, R subunit
MESKATKEEDFEIAIESWLIDHAGYTKVDSSQFDPELALDHATLLSFIKDTQECTYSKLAASYGKDQADAMVVKRIASECDSRGLLDVVRNGVKDRGQHLHLAYFRPPTTLNPDTEKLYSNNRLTVMRQVHFDLGSKASIDMLLSLNGLPIATVELKNAFTGQRSINAIKQYIKDRIPGIKTPLIQYKKRALVHFAVDTDDVYMTTRLAGDSTFFLPFNTGNNGGKGNPVDHEYATGYKTGYLWENIWQRDSWLDIIHRFIHLQVDETRDIKTGKIKKKETLIFPRYNQLDVTRKLIATSRDKGIGDNYLIQHSAGSGKTNTISWTAHQLASLHDRNNNSIFSSVVVVSDRRNLDKQLQDSIYQIDHKYGLVAKIDDDKHSSDLADELNKGTKIIITTLQKFSFLMDKVRDLSGRNFAVIVDEAHSSQSGRSAGHLRGVLGGITNDKPLTEDEKFAAAEAEDTSAEEPPSLEDLVIAEAKSRGKQANISFYAFTATPKKKTLEMFGIVGKDGKPHPFHLYSMRQAIEERFILDVLKHYTTYNTYYKLSKAIEDDPEFDEKKAKKAIARYMTLHPHNIAQKTKIMVEHFRNFTMKKINGQAKAMVVTRSRLHAVRYKMAFDKYILDHGYSDIKALVAFSGTVVDPDIMDADGKNKQYSEYDFNGFSEKELPGRFATPEYQLLIVAEKYQTGFDQPLLHTMFVDKPLLGLKAVQTLSRLNRTTTGKVDTFILDFANNVDDIKDSFKPYFENTEIDEPTDPNQLYSLQTAIQDAPVIRSNDVDEFSKIYFKPQGKQSKRDHGQLNKWIDPAVDRYREAYRDPKSTANEEKYIEDGEIFKSTLQAFIRLYGFLSQIIDWRDAELEKLYAYGRYLLTKLPYRSNSGMIDLDDDVVLSSYRNEKTFEGSAALKIGETDTVGGPTEVGTAGGDSGKTSPLSAIITKINERFGTTWTEEDRLLFDQISGDMAKDEKLTEQARVNSKDQFKQVFEPKAMTAFVTRMGRNEKIVGSFMTNPEMRTIILTALLNEVYVNANKNIIVDTVSNGSF